MGRGFVCHRHLVLLVLVAGACGCEGGTAESTVVRASAAVHVPEKIHVGPAIGHPGVSIPATIPVQNLSDRPLHVRVVEVSSPCCVQVKRGKLRIEPHRADEIQLLVRLTDARNSTVAWVGLELGSPGTLPSFRRVRIEGKLLLPVELVGPESARGDIPEIAGRVGETVEQPLRLLVRYPDRPAGETVARPTLEADAEAISVRFSRSEANWRRRHQAYEAEWPLVLRVTMPPEPGVKILTVSVDAGSVQEHVNLALHSRAVVSADPPCCVLKRCTGRCTGHEVSCALRSDAEPFTVGVPPLPRGITLAAVTQEESTRWKVRFEIRCDALADPLSVVHVPLRGVAQAEVKVPILFVGSEEDDGR